MKFGATVLELVNMHLKPKIWRAYDLSGDNQDVSERLTKKFRKLKKRASAMDAEFQRNLERHFDDQLAPFATSFSRLKNVDLENLDLLERVPAIKTLSPSARKVSTGAVKGFVSIAGGASAGAGAGALTFTAVGAFAAASTGTAISSLSGAAATSATLAWLGGGSLAAGGAGVAGGTLVLASVVAFPVVLAAGGFVSYQGGKELSKQKQVREELREADAQLKKEQAFVKVIGSRIADCESTLDVIAKQMGPLNYWLQETLETEVNYRNFDQSQRNKLGLLVSLATVMTAAMSEPLLSSETEINGEHASVMERARVGLSSAADSK